MKTLVFLLALFAACGSRSFAQSWSSVTSGATTKLFTVHFLTPDTGWIGGEGQVIRKTTDGGATWIAQPGSPGNVTAFQFINPNFGWAVGGLAQGGGFLIKTTNGGASWIEQTVAGGLPISWGLAFPDSLRGWITSEGGAIRRTTDGGVTWTTQSSGTSNDFRRVWFRKDANTGWAVGLNGTIRKTTNGGVPWVSQNSGTTQHLVEVSFVTAERGWCVGTGGTLLRTTNGGTTWTAQTSGTSVDLASVFFLDTATGYVGGGNGLILKTTNGGTTWSTQNTIPATQMLHKLQIFSSGHGWAAGDNGRVMKLTPPAPAPPSQFFYSSSPISYEEGKPIPANVPSIQGTAPIVYHSEYSLPPGLTMNPNTGAVTGTPAPGSSADVPAGQTYTYPVIATNSAGSATTDLVITITPPVASITAGRPAGAFSFQAGNGPPLVFPSPATGARAVRVEIRNARGSKILDKIVMNDNFNWTPASSREAPAGVYSLRLTWRDPGGRTAGAVARTFVHLP